jgi:hypothetical protein
MDTFLSATSTFSITATLEGDINDLNAGAVRATQNGIQDATST